MDETQARQRQQRPHRRRSIAWVYYAILAAAGVYVGFDIDVTALIPAVLCAAYSVYLFRGGRYVWWIW
ncbi:hypothetical protein [Lentzea sp. NBRC 105346]|uniref:hypothetical protein n=1 Tax=Lentzea sp. NBRC 105346 TaxID=3032205 RepID=UPI0025540065|nr:hypothetical protein [Lentzea sp. NBRC 105346]